MVRDHLHLLRPRRHRWVVMYEHCTQPMLHSLLVETTYSFS